MIATDTSTLSAYFKGETGLDVDLLDNAFASGDIRLPPVVLTEMLSDPRAGAQLEAILSAIQLLDITDGYWFRAGQIRRQLLRLRVKVKVADALIAQSCLDHDVLLITRDSDFRHFAKHCGLKLA